MAGYSRLMGADEEGALERLMALPRELVDPKIAEHRGRIVKTRVMACWSNLPVSSMPSDRELYRSVTKV
jgi:class 3 adenylate cyclase